MIWGAQFQEAESQRWIFGICPWLRFFFALKLMVKKHGHVCWVCPKNGGFSPSVSSSEDSKPFDFMGKPKFWIEMANRAINLPQTGHMAVI